MCKDDKRINCKARGVVCEIECLEEGCSMEYLGQTGRSIYERMKKITTGNKKMKLLVRHSRECHEGLKFCTKMRIKLICDKKLSPFITKKSIKYILHTFDLLLIKFS